MFVIGTVEIERLRGLAMPAWLGLLGLWVARFTSIDAAKALTPVLDRPLGHIWALTLTVPLAPLFASAGVACIFDAGSWSFFS